MLYQQIAQNKRKTIYVLIVFTALVGAIGAAVGYLFFKNLATGLVIALIMSLIYSFIMISNSTNVVMQMNHAREITSVDQYPMLWHIVEDLSMVAHIPMPRIFIVQDPSPNAFATGNNPNKAAVAVTTGILDRLNREEMEGVLAHEVSHIRNYDIRVSTIALALTTVISIFVSMSQNFMFFGGGFSRGNDDNDNRDSNPLILIFSIILIILGPIAASIAQMALSRNREYLADASGVELTRNPVGLINALAKISQSEPMKKADPNSAAFYIDDPFKGKKKHGSLFDTHPTIESRIERLEHM